MRLRRRGIEESPCVPDPLIACMKNVSVRSFAVCAVTMRALDLGSPASAHSSFARWFAAA